MPVSPFSVVQDGAGPFVGTLNGVNLTPGNLISIKLSNFTSVVDWYLQVTGTDETSTPPVLSGVNIISNKVNTPSTVVTFPMPLGAGRAFLFSSTVTGPGGPLTTTFTVYVLTVHGFRVGATGEQRETNATFGWAAILNPLIRTGAGVIRYDDTLALPVTGATNVQDIIDILKGISPISGTSTDVTLSCPPTVAILDAVYIVSPGTVDKASAVSIATAPALGLVVSKPSPTTAIVRISGEVPGFGGLLTGSTYFLGIIPGDILSPPIDAPGHVAQVLGVAANPTTLVVNASANLVML